MKAGRGIGRWRSALAIMLLGAVLMIWLYATGDQIHSAPSREELIAAIWRHVGYGVVTAPLLLGYVLWRLRSDQSTFLKGPFPERAGKFALFALVVGVTFLIVTGPLVVWTHGSPLKVFDWFVIANPIGAQAVLHENLETAHGFVARLTPWWVGIDLLLYIWLGLDREMRRG